MKTITSVPENLDLEYFEKRSTVDPATGCWEWAMKRGGDGYGYCYAIRHLTVMAHRVAYAALRGPVAGDLTIDHLCRNRACVNPDHLELVTQAENNRRAPLLISTINAAKTHCVNGHEFDDANTYRAPDRRRCRACSRDASARYKARRGAVKEAS